MIVLTTSKSQDEINRCYELGAAAVLNKPMRLRDYREMLGAFERFWLGHVRFPDAELMRCSPVIKVLLVEDNAADAQLTTDMLVVRTRAALRGAARRAARARRSAAGGRALRRRSCSTSGCPTRSASTASARCAPPRRRRRSSSSAGCGSEALAVKALGVRGAGLPRQGPPRRGRPAALDPLRDRAPRGRRRAAPLRGDRRVLRRRDRHEGPRRDHHELERRRRAALRLHAATR